MAADVLVELLNFRNYSHERCGADLLSPKAERYTAVVPYGRVACKKHSAEILALKLPMAEDPGSLDFGEFLYFYPDPLLSEFLKEACLYPC